MNRCAELLLPTLALFWACSAPSSPPSDSGAERPMSSAVRFVKARPADDIALLEVPAQAVVASGVDGKVAVLERALVRKILVRAGDQIEAKDPIAVVVIPEVVRAAAELLATRARLGGLSQRLAELRALQREGLTRKEQLFELEREVSGLEAQQLTAKAALSAYGLSESEAQRIAVEGSLTLRSPVRGVIAEVRGVVGGVIEASTTIAEIRGLGNVRIEATVPRPIPAEARAEFVDTQGRHFMLRSTPVGSVPDNGGERVWLELAEPSVLPGDLSGRLVLRLSGPAITSVPSRAIQTRGSSARVLSKTTTGELRPLEVEVLLSSPSSAIVRGLREGTEIASDFERAEAAQPKVSL